MGASDSSYVSPYGGAQPTNAQVEAALKARIVPRFTANGKFIMLDDAQLFSVSAICKVDVMRDGSLWIVMSNSGQTFSTSPLTKEERVGFFSGLSLNREEIDKLESYVDAPAR